MLVVSKHTHCCVCLSDTSGHTSQKTSCTGIDTSRKSSTFHLSSCEQEHGSLSRSLNPSLQRLLVLAETYGDQTHPWDETLVEPCNTSTSPDAVQRLEHCLRAIRSHLRFNHLQGLAKSCDLRTNIRWRHGKKVCVTRLLLEKKVRVGPEIKKIDLRTALDGCDMQVSCQCH